jgi:hypothetical protein
MHPIRFSYTPAALDADGLANDVAYSGGGYALTATTPNDSLAHIITILGNAATNHSAKTFTVTGTDANDLAISEGIAGPNGVATVSTTKHFKTVTSVTVSATTGADTFDIGWSAVAVGPIFPLNWRQTDFQVSLGVAVTGTIDVTVQHTFDALHSEYSSSLTWFPHASLGNVTANEDGNYAFPVTATRLMINSVTAGGTVTFLVIQGN